MQAEFVCVLSALCAAPLEASAAPAERLAVARVELSGPLERLVLRTGGAGARWDSRLALGERIAIALPLWIPAGAPERPPELSWSGAGSARFVGWDRDAPSARELAWNALPAGLRARPSVQSPLPTGRRAPLAAVALALAGSVAVLAARRRASVAAGCSLASAVLAFQLAVVPRAARRLCVVEIDGASGGAAALESSRDELGNARADDLRWEVTPGTVRPMTVSNRASDRIQVVARGALLKRWRVFAARSRELGPDLNRWGTLAPAWRRDSDGQWREVSAWPAGLVLDPQAGRSGRDPPGWLNPAQPAGSYVILGRWVDAPAEFDGAEVWVRWIGR